jgi:serine acetyltransferase
MLQCVAMRFRKWVLQDWSVNAGRPESQLLLAWFRLAQWAEAHRGAIARLVITPNWVTSSLLLGAEMPVSVTIGPRLRIHHWNGIVLSPYRTLGIDRHLRLGVTIGNKVDRAVTTSELRTSGTVSTSGHAVWTRGGDQVRARLAVVAGNHGRVIRIDDPAPRN